MEKKYYVYNHVTLTGEVFYVGKGTDRRAWATNGRSRFWKKVANKHGYNVVIVQDDMTEDDAFALEIDLIAQHGRRDKGTGTLVNLTDGGEGPSGRVNLSEKTKWREILESEGLGVILLSQENHAVKHFAAEQFGSHEVTTYTESSVYEPADECDDMWEAFTLAHRATPKQAELADRKRSCIQLDSRGRPMGPRRSKLTAAQKGDNIRARRAGRPLPHTSNPYAAKRDDSVSGIGPVFSPWSSGRSSLA